MAQIKAYTDLEQSKKLAEILPLETADMYYEEVCNLPKAIVGNYILHNQCMEDKDYKKLSNPVLSPAWSLAALLEVMPSEIKDNHYLTLEKETLETGDEYCCCYEDTNGNSFKHTFADNPIDACFDMITKLHERGLL